MPNWPSHFLLLALLCLPAVALASGHAPSEPGNHVFSINDIRIGAKLRQPQTNTEPSYDFELFATGRVEIDPETMALRGLFVKLLPEPKLRHDQTESAFTRLSQYLDLQKLPSVSFYLRGAKPIAPQSWRIDGELDLVAFRRPITLVLRINDLRRQVWPVAADPLRPREFLSLSGKTAILMSDYGATPLVSMGLLADQIELKFDTIATRN